MRLIASERLLYFPLLLSAWCLSAESQLSLLSTNASALESIATKPARMAVMAFQADGTNEASRALAHLCEESLMVGLSRNRDIELVEREQIEKVLEELVLSGSGSADDVLKTGELLGTDLMILGRIGLGYANRRVEVVILEVVTGNPLAAIGVNLMKPCEPTIQRLVDDVVKSLPNLLQARQRDAGKPSVAILNVKNISRLNRLDFLEPTIRGVLEETVAATKQYRLLHREHAKVMRTETELSFAGWIRPSDAVIAERADITLIAELEEQDKPGLTFPDTPITVTVRRTCRDGRRARWPISGKAGDLHGLLSQLMQKVQKELGQDPAIPMDTAQSQSLEALDLFRQAVGEKCWDLLLTAETAPVRTGYGNDPEIEQRYYEHLQVDGNRNIALLEQALYLDPSLIIARFWLGYSLLRICSDFQMTDKEQFKKMNKRAARELELFLERGPRGEYREAAYYDAIICYTQAGEWPRAIELLKRYMTEPPKKYMSDNLHNWGYIYYANVLHDTEKTIQWQAFVNQIYGAEHLKYNVACPYLDLASYFLRINEAQKALQWYERAEKEHGCGLNSRSGSAYGEGILEDIYRALGRTNEANAAAEVLSTRVNLEFAASERNNRYMSQIPQYMTNLVPILPALPDELTAKIRALDAEQNIRAVGFHTSGTYVFTVSGRNLSGFGGFDVWAKNTYITNRLLYWPGNRNDVVDLNMQKNKVKPRITVILPWGEHVWFGSHEGLARYHPKTGTWKWYGAELGLPTSNIFCGIQIGDTFWMAGSQCAFSFDPQTEQFRTYLPDIPLASDFLDFLWIEPSSFGVVVYNRCAHFVIDPISGKWREIQ